MGPGLRFATPSSVVEFSNLMPEEVDKAARCILLLCDSWNCTSEGITGVNQSIALALSRYKGIQVYSTVFLPLNSISEESRSLAEQNNITLISLASTDDSSAELYALFNENPEEFFQGVRDRIPSVSHIVGHSPITAEAALKLRDSLYTESKVLLFYHVIPREVEIFSDQLPYVIPTDSEQVRLGELADVVYSVSEKLHWYYTAKFRNRATTDVDHRLFLPQSSDKVFDLKRQSNDSSKPTVFTVGYETASQLEWSGLDISACSVSKVIAAAAEDSEPGASIPSLKIVGDVSDEIVAPCHDQFSRPDFVVDVSKYRSSEDLYRDLSTCSLCIVPSRVEPFGYMGLHALSAGIPTLIAEDSCLATLVKRLTSEPESLLVPVTPGVGSVRQDGSVWRDRIQAVLRDPETAASRATQLRMALRRDELTKETHDNFITYCLGGIYIKHEITSLSFQYRKDEEKELPVTRSFNRFLTAALKQCWRYKHHPLTQDVDLYQIIPGVDLPIRELVQHVTDKIEEYDRRIVGIDKESGCFIVYCPTPEALSDLWAMCDVINRSLHATLLAGDDNDVLMKMKLKAVGVRTIISGPQFLTYKSDLMKNCSQTQE